MDKKILIYDLDETLCEKKRPEQTYSEVKPIKPMIEQLNRFYDEGHTIIIQTARNMVTQGNDVGKVLQNVGEITLKWLRENNVKYHSILFGKAYGSMYIDDKSVRPSELMEYGIDGVQKMLIEEKEKIKKYMEEK